MGRHSGQYSCTKLYADLLFRILSTSAPHTSEPQFPKSLN